MKLRQGHSGVRRGFGFGKQMEHGAKYSNYWRIKGKQIADTFADSATLRLCIKSLPASRQFLEQGLQENAEPNRQGNGRQRNGELKFRCVRR